MITYNIILISLFLIILILIVSVVGAGLMMMQYNPYNSQLSDLYIRHLMSDQEEKSDV